MYGDGTPSIIEAFEQGGLTFTPSDAAAASTPQLVHAYVDIHVRYAVHAATTPEVAGWFGPLSTITVELAARGVVLQ